MGYCCSAALRCSAAAQIKYSTRWAVSALQRSAAAAGHCNYDAPAGQAHPQTYDASEVTTVNLQVSGLQHCILSVSKKMSQVVRLMHQIAFLS